MSEQKTNLEKILGEVSGIKELHNLPGFQEESARLRERLSDDEFRIAVVGEFSSGKSTFINAMLGQDVLQHATTETTAAVTRIINVTADDPRRMTGRVITRDGKEIIMPDLQNLKDFTTTQSERYQNRVPDEIAFVEIFLPFMVCSRPVVLVDTPGLNGMAEGHREQTVALIQKAHACIYLIPRSGLGESDILFLTYLAKFQRNFIFIQNFIDEFQASEGDTVDKKLEEQRAILNSKVFAQNPECGYDLCGVSALMELASVDQNIDRLYADSPKPLTPEDRIQLHEQSGFEQFRQMMNQVFREENMDEIQYGGTMRAIANWIESLLEHVSRQEQQAREFFDASGDKRALEKLERLREKILAGEQRQRENLQNFIIARGDELRREAYSSLKQQFENLNNQVSEQMNAIHVITQLEQFEKRLPELLGSKVGIILADSNDRLHRKFQILYQILLTKIDEYSGMKSNEELNLESLVLSALPAQQSPFVVAQNRVDELQDKLKKKKQESRILQDENAKTCTELRKASASETALQRAQRDIEVQKNKDIQKIGSRPQAREYEESYTVSVPHGGFGIIDFFFGYKEVTRYRTVRDDSAGKKWDQQYAQIQNAFVIRKEDLSKEIAAARRKKNELTTKQQTDQTRIQTLEDKIQELERKIKLEREKVEDEKQKAAQEYLNQCKVLLREQVQAYLLGETGIIVKVDTSIASFTEKTVQSFIQLAMDRFTQALQQKIRWIDQMQEEKRPALLQQMEHLEEITKRLKKIKEEMEGA